MNYMFSHAMEKIKHHLKEEESDELLNYKFESLNTFSANLNEWIKENILLENSDILNMLTKLGAENTKDMTGVLIKMFYLKNKFPKAYSKQIII